MRISQNPFSRCSLLVVMATLATAWPALADTTHKTFTRPRMLEDMARNCVIRGVMELATNADELNKVVQELSEKPSETTLAKAQNAWKEMYFTHMRYRMLTYGPIEDQVFWSANFYWRPSPVAIEDVVRTTRPIDATLIERMGGSTTGFAALECLLFDSLPTQAEKVMPVEAGRTNSSISRLLEGDYSVRRRLYLHEAANNLQHHLQKAAQDAQAKDFPIKFVAGGQDSVNLLVNEFTVTLESGIIGPLKGYTNQLMIKKLHIIQVEGAPSRTTLTGMEVLFEGLHGFYDAKDGWGLGDYVRRVNPGMNERFETQFKATSEALKALKGPLESTALTQQPALEAALDEARKLEILCKVDLVSAFGVTIMFNANDGD